jgi:hypothetical protein
MRPDLLKQAKEPEALRKERIRLAKTVQTKVKKSKTVYSRKKLGTANKAPL